MIEARQGCHGRRLIAAWSIMLVGLSLVALGPTPALAETNKVSCLWEFASRWGGTTVGGAQVEIRLSECDSTTADQTYHLVAVLTGPDSYRAVVYDGDGTDCYGTARDCYLLGSAAGPNVVGNLGAGAWTLTMTDSYTYTNPDLLPAHGRSVSTVHIPAAGPTPTLTQTKPPTAMPTPRPRPIATATRHLTASPSQTEIASPTSETSPSGDPVAPTVSATPTTSPSGQATNLPSPCPSGLTNSPPSGDVKVGGNDASQLALALLAIAAALLTLGLIAFVRIRRHRAGDRGI